MSEETENQEETGNAKNDDATFPTISRESLSGLSLAELKDKAAEMKTDITGKKTKAAIIDAILLEQNIFPANVVFVGRRKALNPETNKFEMTEKDVPPSYSLPSGEIKLPKDIAHGVPFYHKDAELLKSALPLDFKNPVNKGDKS